VKDQLQQRLTTRELGRSHEHYDSLTSTNDRGAQWLREGAVHGSLVTADTQTAGRGRRGRMWSSPRGQLYASVLLRAGPRSASIGALGLAVAAGLQSGLAKFHRAHAALSEPMPVERLEIKWPNDLLVGGKKIGGILCETRWRGNDAEIVVGFGLNLHRRKFDASLDQQATTLEAAWDLKSGLDSAAALATVLAELEPMLERFFLGGFPAIRADYLPHCCILGQELWVPVTHPDGSADRIRVIALGLDEDGALRVRSREGGREFRVESGDVWFVNPRGGNS